MFFYGIVAVRHCMTMTILSWWSDSDDLHGIHWSVNLLMTSHGLVIAGQQVMRKLMELFGAQIYDPWPFPNSLTSYGRHIRSNYVLGKSLICRLKLNLHAYKSQNVFLTYCAVFPTGMLCKTSRCITFDQLSLWWLISLTLPLAHSPVLVCAMHACLQRTH